MLGLEYACLVLLLLLAKLRDLALQLSHELVLVADHVRDCLLRRHQERLLLRRLRLVLQEVVLDFFPLLSKLIRFFLEASHSYPVLL